MYEDYIKLLKNFTNTMKKALQDNLISMVLYGSVARQEATPQSDIDILPLISSPLLDFWTSGSNPAE